MSQPYSPPNSAMPEGSSSCRSRAQTTVRSRNSTKPASVSAAAATPALRGIDLRGHHHTWPGPGNRRRRLRDCPCAMSSNEKHEQPRPGQTQSWPPDQHRGRRISAARTLARDLPPAAPGRPRPRSSPCSDPTPSSGPPTPPNYPGDQAIELLAWMVPAHIATTPPAGNTPDDASPDGPCRMAARTHGFARQSHSYRQPAAPRPGHHADPSREVRATADVASKT